MTNKLEKLKAENKRFKETLDELFKIQYQLADNCKKLRQCLTEIKEIAEKHQATAHCCYLEDMTEIIQKISECEE